MLPGGSSNSPALSRTCLCYPYLLQGCAQFVATTCTLAHSLHALERDGVPRAAIAHALQRVEEVCVAALQEVTQPLAQAPTAPSARHAWLVTLAQRLQVACALCFLPLPATLYS